MVDRIIRSSRATFDIILSVASCVAVIGSCAPQVYLNVYDLHEANQ